MKLLADFLDRNPLGIGAIGTTAGLGTWLAEQLHLIAGIAADVGLIFGASTAVLSFFLIVTKRDRKNRQQRRQFRDQPFEDDLP